MNRDMLSEEELDGLLSLASRTKPVDHAVLDDETVGEALDGVWRRPNCVLRGKSAVGCDEQAGAMDQPGCLRPGRRTAARPGSARPVQRKPIPALSYTCPELCSVDTASLARGEERRPQLIPGFDQLDPRELAGALDPGRVQLSPSPDIPRAGTGG